MNNYKLQFLKILSAFIFGISTMSVMGGTDLTISRFSSVHKKGTPDITSFSATPGNDLMLEYVVPNIGDVGSPGSSIEFFLSDDQIWDVNDVYLDSLPIRQIPVADTLTSIVHLGISDTITMYGQYYIFAYVDIDNLIAEDDETNNVAMVDCYISVVDLTISGIFATPDPVGVFETLSVDYTLNNAEGFGHGPTTCTFHFSNDTVLDDNDVYLGYDVVPANNSSSSPQTGVDVDVPNCLETGDYYLIVNAVASESITETIDTNNYASYAISVIQATTDLYLSKNPFEPGKDYYTLRPDDNIEIKRTIHNRGGEPATHSDISYFLSDDDIFDGADVMLASNTGGSLNCGGSRTVTQSLTIPTGTSDGIKYILIVADPLNTIAEEVETNNTNSVPVVISANPDIRITSASVSPTNIEPGTMVTAICTIQNFGTSIVGKSVVGVYFSATSGVHDEFLIGELYDMLNPGETASFSKTFAFNENCLNNGTNYILIHGHLRNMMYGDDNPTNNGFEQVVTIYNSYPDLLVTGLTAEPTVMEPGQKTIIEFTVANEDKGNANGLQVTEFYLSTDNVIDGGDLLLGTDTSYIGCWNHRYSEIVEIPIGTATGDYVVIAKTDINNDISESDETNNQRLVGVIVSEPLDVVETYSLSDGKWKEISWSNGNPDGSNYKAIVNHQVSVYENTSVNKLDIGTTGKLTVSSGDILLVQDTVIAKSDASGTASLIDYGQLAVYGASIAQRWFDANKWHFISSPVANATTEVFTDMYLMSFNETSNSYSEITSTTDTLTTMTGYAVYNFADTTVAFSGDFNTGSLLASDLSNDNLGFHLLGNPYASSINWDRVSHTTIDDAIYIENDGDWATYIEGVGGVNGGSNIIAPMQGFIVKVSTGQTSGSLSLSNHSRTHESATFYKSSSSLANNTIKLQISADGKKDESLIHFNGEATIGFDSRWDAEKLSPSAEIPQIYSLGGSNMAINSLPLEQLEGSVSLGITVFTDGIHSIGLGDINLDENVDVILEDIETNIFTNLKASTYSFVSGIGSVDNRFVLHFGSPNSVEELESNNSVSAYALGNTLYVNFNREVENAQIEVYNIMGKHISALNASNTTNESIALDVQTGVYLVSISTESNVITKKVFIK